MGSDSATAARAAARALWTETSLSRPGAATLSPASQAPSPRSSADLDVAAGAFRSQPLTTAQQKFVHQFRRPGVFPYHCAFHGGPGGKGMAGVVTVVERTP